MANTHPSIDDIAKQVKNALEEDIFTGDITAALIPSAQIANAQLVVKEKAILCGQRWFESAFWQLDDNTDIKWQANDGDLIHQGDVVCTLTGTARNILTAERTAINFLQTLSGTATSTHTAVQQLKDFSCQLLDTRKTIPGFRLAQKYAVKTGGGTNHRMGLFDAFLIKENHIAAAGGIKSAIDSAKKMKPNTTIEVEVESLEELQEAINANADVIMLDNFSMSDLAKAVQLNQKQAKLEVSGNVDYDQLLEIAGLGIDYISMGALTKHVRAIDFSLRIETHN